jgi:hypothetical protein
MEIDRAAVKAEIEAAAHSYEAALTTNDNEMFDRLFLNSAGKIRSAIVENIHDCHEIAAFRASRPAVVSSANGIVRSQIRAGHRDGLYAVSTHSDFNRERLPEPGLDASARLLALGGCLYQQELVPQTRMGRR